VACKAPCGLTKYNDEPGNAPLGVVLRQTITPAVSRLFIQLQKTPRTSGTAALRQKRSFADERRIADFDPKQKSDLRPLCARSRHWATAQKRTLGSG
jgi:hypothetical protein